MAHYDKNTALALSLLLAAEKKTTRFCLALMATGSLLFGALHWLGLCRFSSALFWIIAAYSAAVSLRYWLLKYRIDKGWYGGNCYEVREILQFLDKLTAESAKAGDGDAPWQGKHS